MAQAFEQAIRLVSGALGATSFDQLLPGTLVNDEFGHFYGIVAERYLSPHPDFRDADAKALGVIVKVDSHIREVFISGRYLEPLVHGPGEVMQGYQLLAKLINPHAETTWAERVRP